MGLFYDDFYHVKLFWVFLGCFGGFILLIGLFLLFVFGCSCVNWSTGEKTYTGYIYSAEDEWGDSTEGHLRFSENAGEDVQPAFCVKKNDGQKIKELAGSGKKVRVTVPTGFAFTAPWNCPIPANVEVISE